VDGELKVEIEKALDGMAVAEEKLLIWGGGGGAIL